MGNKNFYFYCILTEIRNHLVVCCIMINTLPEELIAYILSFLKKYKDVGRAAQVCSLWRRLAWAVVPELHLRKFSSVLELSVFENLLSSVPYASYIQLHSEASNSHIHLIHKHLNHLQVLNLRRCREITNEGLTVFENRGLRKVYLSTSWNISNLDFLAGSCHTLKSLELRGCDLLTSETFVSLRKKTRGKQFLQITYLDLRDCRLLDDLTFRVIADLMPNLKQIDASGCAITVDGIQQLTKLHQLGTLLLWGCNQLTDNALKILTTFPLLKKLNLIDCDLLSDHGLRYLSKCRELHYLELGSIGLTNRGVDYIFNLESLKQLSILSSTTNLTREEIQQFIDSRKPELEFQYVQLAV